VATWSRRVSVAHQRPAGGNRSSFSREALLREAVKLGVLPDDQAAILALARVAAEREGFRSTLAVRTNDGPRSEILFEVANTAEGPVARRAGTAATDLECGTADLTETADDDDRDEEHGIDVVHVLTDTLVHTPDLVAVFASVGHEALWANDAFVTLIPIRESDKVWLVELLDEWSKGHYEVKVLPALVKYGRWRGRLTLVAGDDTMPVSAVIAAHRDQHGEIEAVSMVARDLSELRVADERVAAGEARFSALVEHVSDLIAVIDINGTIRYASPAIARALGHPEGALTDGDLRDLIHPEDRPASFIDLAKPDEQGLGSPVELRLQSADGAWRYLELVVSDLRDNPAIRGLVINARDVTDRVEAVQALATKAFTDQLTGLPNRMRLLDRLAQALQESGAEASACVVLIDIDGFRSVGEGLGQGVSDAVIRTVGQRLADVAGTTATTARLRNDEFAVVMRDLADRAEALRLANRLRKAVNEPISVEGNSVRITASIGVAFNEDGHEPEDLMRCADHAMVHAKDQGGDRTEVFSGELAARESHRRAVEQRLRLVIDRASVVVHYQPMIAIGADRIVGAEALLRIDDGDGALLSPAEFVDAAESTGLITRLGSQTLQATTAQLAAWSAEVGTAACPEVFVNVSPRQLADSDLPQHVLGALDAAGVEAGHLCLEITESMLIGAQSTVDANISYLRTLGVKVGLDEFGAGRSSLGYLKRFPLDFVKIDRTLVSGLGTDEQDTAIVRATVELAHNLGLFVVAVGVETDEQLEMLQLLGCDRAQGYLFGPAVPAEELSLESGR
jgi:diguanylate cyclase (GGDEF)-like protein/PAS domain S-box-containing protein